MHLGSSYELRLVTPRACTRGKVIGLYVCHCRCCCCRRCQHENHQISRCRHLLCWKHNESVDICEKLVSVRFTELLSMAHKCYKSYIFRSACLWFTDHTQSDLAFLSQATRAKPPMWLRTVRLTSLLQNCDRAARRGTRTVLGPQLGESRCARCHGNECMWCAWF